MISINTGYVGDFHPPLPLKSLLNDSLKDEQFADKNIELLIMTAHFQSGVSNVIADFKNYDDKATYDHVCYVHINGIDKMTDDYDTDHRYTVNNTDYWKSFVDAEILSFSDYVEYQSAIDETETDREALNKYLMNDYDGFIEFTGIDAVTFPDGTPMVEMTMTVSAEAVAADGNYASVTELVDSVRQSVNEYYDSNPDDKFLNLRIQIDLIGEDGSSLGEIANFDSETKNDLGGFNSVWYKEATADELIACEDIKIINLYGRSFDEDVEIIDNSSGLQVIIVRKADLIDKLSVFYPTTDIR